MITKWKLSPLSPFEEKIVGASLCVFVCFTTFYQIVWVSPYPFSESWEMRLATPCLVSSFDNFTFQNIKKFIFLSTFFILYILHSIYLFHIQCCHNVAFYEDIIFLNEYYKNKLRTLYHEKKKKKKILSLKNIQHQNFDSWKINEFEETRRHGSSRNEFRRRNFL